jgi:hypothetical protein
MSTAHTQQQQHDTLAQREADAAAHPAPFDVIWDWVRVGAMCVFATGVFAFVVGALAAQMKNHC